MKARALAAGLMTAMLGSVPVMAMQSCSSSVTRNCFTGSFGLVDIADDKKHKLLENDFGYVDPKGVGWQTNKGAKTDGASIPLLLQPFVGSPWENAFIRAAVIHDWYCDRHVRTWEETHRVFYDVLLATGLAPSKAKLLFYAVYAFGPTWGYTIPGKPCSGTAGCIQTTGTPVFVKIGSQYDKASIDELKAVEAMIEVAEGSGGLSIDQLIAVADRAHPKLPLLDKVPSTGITK